MAAGWATRPLQREIRILVGSLAALLVILVVALLALTVSLLRLDRVATTADSVVEAVAPVVEDASPSDLTSRLEALRLSGNIDRIEIYRGEKLIAASGLTLSSAEVLTRPIRGGRMLLYFKIDSWAGGRRIALITGAVVIVAGMAGVLLLIGYVPKFLRPVEEMLDEARRLNDKPTGDHDSRYLLHTFREAVERVHQQSTEIDHLRDAASSRSTDVLELARALNNSFTSGFLAVDANGMVVVINDAGRQILGIGADVPAPSLHAFPQAFAATVQASIASRAPITRQEVLLDAPAVLIGVTTVPLFDNESYLGLLALFTDLTTVRAMEGRLRDLEALVGLGQMSAGIAHEFRNSLFTILGYLQLAQRDAAGEQLSKIQKAEREAKAIAGAIDALLNFTKPLNMKMQRVRIGQVARSVMERFAATHPEIEIVTSIEQDPEINGDPELLDRALDNVIRNSVDAVRERHAGAGGRIETIVSAEPDPVIEVRDNGVGIDPAQAANYVLPFQSGKAQGSGLGLALARKIILHHGGTLTLTGTPGEGALVRIAFFT